jgi:ribosome-associated translation inhibitor RaiA
MDNENFPINFNNEIDKVKESENELYAKASNRLWQLAEGHNDILSGSIDLKEYAKEHGASSAYEVKIMLYLGSDHIVATEKGQLLESTLESALDAVERQVHEQRVQQRKY